MRLGLALSGGGFRATLYHLGVVRYLKDAGLLGSVSHITSVSGGSILAAHMVMNWERYTESDEDFDNVAEQMLDFTRLDVRNRIIRRYPFAFALGTLRYVVRLSSLRNLTRTGLLELHYRDHLFGDTCLYELPEAPELHILSTNLSEGGLFSFSRSGLFCEERLKSGTGQIRRIPVGLTTVPMAVAASSAFPGFFPPLELSSEDIGETESEFQRQFFTDGGVYDNLGARMFRYLECGAACRDGSSRPPAAVAPNGQSGSGASATTRDARRLQRSSRRSFRSILSANDWVSYLYLPVLLLVFGALPFLIYQTWNQTRFNEALSEAISAEHPYVDKLIELLTAGTEPPWEGMGFKAGRLEPLFAERGLDIISDTRVIDLRRLEVPGGRVPPEESAVYIYRVVAVRKNAHVEGETALLLPSLRGATSPLVRCNHPELTPLLEHNVLSDSGGGESDYAWQLKLNFDAVPIGHTTKVIVEAMWPARSAMLAGQPMEWWGFQVDAEPEVINAWILVPETWMGSSLRLVRHPNGMPDNQVFVEATHEASVFEGSVFNWSVVHPKEGYTYTYQRLE
jgi:predicted acylesterase/phospholipase RssA